MAAETPENISRPKGWTDGSNKYEDGEEDTMFDARNEVMNKHVHFIMRLNILLHLRYFTSVRTLR